jgi:pSer/pThr/pTyr-binding forkhead associated (FHA) protein
MSKLICLRGLNKDDQFILHEGKNIIGRAQDATIVLFDKQASRHHCAVFKKGRHYSVQDMDSRNGTLLNKKKLVGRPRTFKAGDKIKIGKTVLVLSEKAMGGLLEQTASDVAADLQSRGFDKLMNRATRDVVQHEQHHESDETGSTISKLFSKIFGK